MTQTTESDLVARLSRHRTLGEAPREELVWLAAHGVLEHERPGDYIARKGDVMPDLFIVLSGHFSISVDRGYGPRKVMEWSGGDVTGLLPYSRMSKAIGDVVVDEPTEALRVPREHFPQLIRECPTVTAALVHVMIDRARRFTSSDLQDEKMMALGRLSAGLAHELNNPASAAARSAGLLAKALGEDEAASQALGAARLSDAQRRAVDELQCVCSTKAPGELSPIERADREDVLADWLVRHGGTADAAASFVDTGLTTDDLEAVAAVLDPASLDLTLRWAAARCTTRALVQEIETAATRVHNLVAAVKRFSYMDRVSTPEAVDLVPGLNDSVALLGHKARKKSISLKVDIAPLLPRVTAIGSDLNQIWTNLIDNALDAAPESGHVSVIARRHLDHVVVRIVDDGPGVPPQIRERIFDPLFTTKPPGQGTGLGLDIARRLARRNDTDIELDSQPGHTEFRVSLRLAVDGAASQA